MKISDTTWFYPLMIFLCCMVVAIGAYYLIDTYVPEDILNYGTNKIVSVYDNPDAPETIIYENTIYVQKGK